ncbi:hypothetical protein Tco_1563122 [Tanacetum coccineum]
MSDLLQYNNDQVRAGGIFELHNTPTISVNEDDMCSIATNICDMNRKMPEGKFVLVGDDGVPFKPMNVDTQSTRDVVRDVNGAPKAWNDENPKGDVMGDKNVTNEVTSNTLWGMISNEVGTRKEHLDYARAFIDIRADRELKDEIIIVIPKVEDDGEVIHTNQSKNTDGFQKLPKRAYDGLILVETKRQEASTSNPFNALYMVENDDDLVTNKGNLKLARNGVNSDVVDSSYGTYTVESSTFNVASNESEVYNESEMYNETTSFMASLSSKVNKGFKSGSRGK